MPKRLLLLSVVAFALVNCGVGTRCFAEATDVSAQFEQAEKYEDARKYKGAEAIYKGIAEAYAGKEDGLRAQQKLVCLYIERGRTAEAETAYKELLAGYTGYGDDNVIADAVDHVADEYRDVKKYDKALEIYRYVVDTWPGSEQAMGSQAGIARVNIALGREEAAQAAIDKLIADFSDHNDIADGLDTVAGEYRDREKYDKALSLYKLVVDGWPESQYAMESEVSIANLNIKLGNEAAAQAAIDKLIADFSGNKGLAKAVDHVADSYRESKQYEKAKELYKYVVDTWPKAEHAIDSQTSLAKLYIRLGDDPNAEGAIEKLIVEFADHNDIADVVDEVADEYRDIKKYEKARELYKLVVDKWPKDENAVWSQMSVALASVAIEDEASAKAAIEKVRSIYGGNEDVGKVVGPLGDYCRYLLGIEEKRKEKAAQTINKLLSDFSKRDAIKAVDHMGDFYRDTNKYDKAVELFEYVADKWFESEHAIESQTNAVKVYISIGDEPNASAAFGKLTEKFAGNERIAWAVWEVGEAYRDDGSVKKAYEKYKQVVEHWPESEQAIWAKMGMVRSLVRQSDLEGAEAELGELLTNFGGHKDVGAVVHEIVEEYRNTGAYEEGRGLFAYLLENWDESESTMLELQVGIVLQNIKLGEPNKAEAAVAKLIADYNDHPNIGKALFQIAEEYFYAENYPKAIELWELIESDFSESSFPNKNEIPFMLGTCYERLKNFDMAIENYTKAIERYPSARFTPRVPYRIGLIYMGYKQDYEKATHWFRQQYQRFDDEISGSRALRHEGFIYLKTLEDYESAKACFENYLTLYPAGENIWEATYGLALCYEKEGNNEQATRLFNEALTKASNQRQREVIEAHLSN